MKVMKLVPVFVALISFLTAANAYSVTWNLECAIGPTFTWQGVIRDSSGPIPPGDYLMGYCYFRDSAGTQLIGCCTSVVHVTELSFNASGEKAATSTAGSGSLKYPVPIQEDTTKATTPDEGNSPLVSLWLELQFDGEIILPRTRINAVPFASVSGRVAGDINTRPGRLALYPTDPSENPARVILNADTIGVGGKITLVNTLGDTAMTLSEVGIVFSNSSVMSTSPVDAGVAQAVEGGGAGTTIDTLVAALISQRLYPPSDGYVLVSASCQARISHVTGTASAINFGVTKNSISLSVDQDKAWTLPSVLPSGTYDAVISAQKIFNVTPLDTVFYLVADKFSGTGLCSAFDMTLSIIFFPEAYGTVEQSSPSRGEDEE